MNNQNNGSKNKKNSPGGWIAAAVIIFLFNLIGAAEGSAIGIIVAVIVIAVFAAAAFIIIKAVKKEKSNSAFAQKGAAAMKNMAEKSEFSWQSRKNETAEVSVAHRPEIRVYDEEAAAHNFARDRQRRIEQLNSFLQNGIIDKAEYKVLLRRFENDI